MLRIQEILSPLIKIFVAVGFIVNLFVILMLTTTDKFNVVFNYININGNLAIVGILLILSATIIGIVINQKNIITNICANSAMFAIPLKLFSDLTGKSNDDGVILKTNLYTIFENYSLNDKKAWIPKIEKELDVDIKNLTLQDIAGYNTYNELKNAALDNIERLRRAKEQQKVNLDETKTTGYDLFASVCSWTWDHKVAIGLTIGVIVVGVLWYNGTLIWPVFIYLNAICI